MFDEWPAEMPLEMIRERVVSGIQAAKSRGKTLGRPRRVFRRDEAVALRASGLSWRKISERMGVPMSTLIDAACTVPENKSRYPRNVTNRNDVMPKIVFIG